MFLVIDAGTRLLIEIVANMYALDPCQGVVR
jgi:hypothetical protein